MGSLVTIGLKLIEIGTLAADGGPATTFLPFGNISTDSFAFAEAEPSVKQVLIEESSAPLKEFKTKGLLQVTANIADPDADMYATLRGGTVTATSGLKTYKEGDDFVDIEKTVRITPAEGLKFTFNRASMNGVLNGGLGKNQELYLALTITALQPLKAGVAVFEAAQTVPVIP